MKYRNFFGIFSSILLTCSLSLKSQEYQPDESIINNTPNGYMHSVGLNSEQINSSDQITRKSKKCCPKKCKNCQPNVAQCPTCPPRTVQKYNESRFTPSTTTTNESEAEKQVAYNRRVAAACISVILQKNNAIETQNNGDEQSVPNFAAQFSKALEHNFINGLLTAQGVSSYKQLVTAINNGKQADFNAIVRAPGATRKLVDPQAGLAFSLQGADSSLFETPRFPTISSSSAAAELIENYLLELDRDVLFSEYGTGMGTDSNGSGGSLTNDAAAVLQDLGAAYTGPRNAFGVVDASVVFRGNFYGSLLGPYISQFFYLPVSTVGAPNFNPSLFINCDQNYPIASGREFGISFNDFVAIQNGSIPKPYTAADFNGKRHSIIGRDIGSWVHFDTAYEAYYNALTILAANNFPLSPFLPYLNGSITNEVPFATLGVPDAFAMIGDVSAEAFKAAWAQKWRADRALRPEAFAGLVQQVKVTGQNPFNLNASLFVPHAGIDVLEQIRAKNTLQAGFPANMLTASEAATYLLSQMFPEASPVHPSYPSGHATVAGACITVIKAIFDDSALIQNFVTPVIPDPVDPTQLIPLVGDDENIITVASELDKLAFNVAIGRNWAGVHYRADALQGILLGERVAIEYLREQACKYSEQTFQGFVITKVDGTRILISANGIIELNSVVS